MIEVSVEPHDFVAGQDAVLAVRFANTGPGICTDIVFKLDLPPQFLLLRGRERIELAELEEGQNQTLNLVVRPGTAGSFSVSSTNFSYRNYYDRPIRESGFQAELSVRSLPADELGRRALTVKHAGGGLTVDEYGVLSVTVRNDTDAAVRGLAVTLTTTVGERFELDRPRIWVALLSPGEAAELKFSVFPVVSGHVPVQVQTAYVDEFGRTHPQQDEFRIAVTKPEAHVARAAAGATRPDPILYLAASPIDLPPLRSDREMREIWEKLQRGMYRDRFRFEPRAAARREDISQALIECKPRIVHFSGHGERDGSVYVEDEYGNSTPAAAKGLAALFEQHAETIECVIVNACHTLRLAEALAEHIDHVIAMPTKILDRTAIIFAVGFYQGLAGGMKVPEAFKEGRALFSTVPIDEQEYQEPVLLTRRAKT